MVVSHLSNVYIFIHLVCMLWLTFYWALYSSLMSSRSTITAYTHFNNQTNVEHMHDLGVPMCVTNFSSLITWFAKQLPAEQSHLQHLVSLTMVFSVYLCVYCDISTDDSQLHKYMASLYNGCLVDAFSKPTCILASLL